MKTRLFLVCCAAALALGTGCATYDTGGTADDTVVVSGTGNRDYYDEPYPYDYSPDLLEYGYHGDPIKDMGRGPAVWKQPSPNGQDWVDARPDLVWYPRRR